MPETADGLGGGGGPGGPGGGGLGYTYAESTNESDVVRITHCVVSTLSHTPRRAATCQLRNTRS